MKTERWEVYINAYLVNRAFGGNEEGGWWYDYGEPLAAVPVALSSPYEIEFDPDEEWEEPVAPDMNGISDDDCERIKAVINDLTKTLAHHNDNRGIGSVLCEGVVRVYTQFHFAKSWPDRRPRYE